MPASRYSRIMLIMRSTGAAGLIYGYTFVIPVGLWGALKWFGSESANLLECLALYGYANLIWIPVAMISWSPLTALNYAFVGVGLGVSALFLFRNLYVNPFSILGLSKSVCTFPDRPC